MENQPMMNWRIQKKQSIWMQVVVVLLLAAFTLAACGGGEETSDSPAAASEGPANGAAAGGPLTFIYLYAEDCAPCEGMEPVVAELETEYVDQLVVERHDASSEEGARLMSEYELTSSPSYVILAADGSKLWSNSGQIHRDMLRQQLTTLLRQ
jgi:thiol-disulfide isomerase/thioredoxin